MNAKHTPGPWKVGSEYGANQLRPEIHILRDVTFVEGASPTTYRIGVVTYPTTTGNTVGAAERSANARLIAAAPELLEALETLDELWGESEVRGVDFSHAIEQARAAIAKARGEA